jgi:hypothetical protein
MLNHYEAPEVVEIGRAREAILGSQKNVLFTVDDSPSSIPRETESADDE